MQGLQAYTFVQVVFASLGGKISWVLTREYLFNKNGINKNENDELKELLEMNVLLPKHKEHYEYFKKKLAACK